MYIILHIIGQCGMNGLVYIPVRGVIFFNTTNKKKKKV